MDLLRHLADRRDPRSLSQYFRRRRARHLSSLLTRLAPPVRILDVGGEKVFWDTLSLPARFDVTLLNAEPQPGSLTGDARHMPQFADRSFDVVISNSVIEHVDDQEAMAREIRRIGRRYYVQTPNRRFPVDPHFLVPLFHLMPRSLQVALLQRFDIGWLSRARSRAEAEAAIDSIRLLTERDLRRLFPEATIWRERFLGLTKSIVAYHGW
jgi:SAM-dependent methyltransferase